MQFRSFDDLNRDIIQNLNKFDKNYDLIVGVPRSGLMVANIIALHLNKPLVDLQGFVEGRVFETGSTRKPMNYDDNLENICKVLIVEDSVLNGNSIHKAKNLIQSSSISNKIKVEYFAAYITNDKTHMVDFYLNICETPRVFEWNIMHHAIVEKSCFDLDGVLCKDPSDEEDDDGKNYIKFIQNAEPLFIPTKKIDLIVTCRLEKYREQTVNWLEKNNVDYNKLIMMNYSTKLERMQDGKHSIYKAHHFINSGSELFVESSLNQAIIIAKISCKPVYCIEVRKMIYPNADVGFGYAGKPSCFMKALRIYRNFTKKVRNKVRSLFGLSRL